ncbi:MAG: rRNA maturation RNase YbeY [Chitinophagaceae bacterium]|nr:rRNA maturation RNase YbeY [Chitinophagaceae bacterium]MCW5929854.1 rRNA maturation RNase YbeY [Chitinophagaceae bacterium]
MPDIKFFFSDRSITIPARTKLKKFIRELLEKKGKRLQLLNYIFCSDEALLEINKTYLQHDFYTDIITFDLSEYPNVISSEVYISVDRIKENAKSLGTGEKEELHRIMFHGVLHLLGYKDKLKAEKLAMTKEEDRLLKLYFSKN